VDRLVVVLLPALAVDQLMDVALVIEQTDADHRHAQVAHALEVIAREHAQDPRIDRDRLVEAELGREVGDGAREQSRGVERPPAVAAAQVLEEPAMRLVDAGLHLERRDPPRDVVAVQAAQHRDRVVVDGAPDLRSELAEDRPDLRTPGPPEVLRELAQLSHQLGSFGHTAAAPLRGSRTNRGLYPRRWSQPHSGREKRGERRRSGPTGGGAPRTLPVFGRGQVSVQENGGSPGAPTAVRLFWRWTVLVAFG